MARFERARPESPAPFTAPTLAPEGPAVRAALAVIAEAVSRRSAELHAAYREAPPQAQIDMICRTFTACQETRALAVFLGVEVPECRDALAAWRAEQRPGRESRSDFGHGETYGDADGSRRGRKTA